MNFIIMRNKRISIKIKRFGLKNTLFFPLLSSLLIDFYNWFQILFWEIIFADSCSLLSISIKFWILSK